MGGCSLPCVASLCPLSRFRQLRHTELLRKIPTWGRKAPSPQEWRLSKCHPMDHVLQSPKVPQSLQGCAGPASGTFQGRGKWAGSGKQLSVMQYMCRVLLAVQKVGMHSLVWVTSSGDDSSQQLTIVTVLCSLHRGSSSPQRCCWKNQGADVSSPNHSPSFCHTGDSPVPTPLLLLSSGKTKTVLCSPHAPLDIFCLLLQLSPSCGLGTSWNIQAKSRPSTGFPHLCIDQEGSQQLVPTS